MRYYINCNYNERNEVKKLGAMWDAVKKQWYFTNSKDTKKFEKWLPETFDDEVKKTYPSLTAICKDLDLERSCVRDWLCKCIYNVFLIP